MSGTVLEISNLRVHFPGLFRDTEVLRDIGFTIERGEVFGLVGESGSGKSMTASACLGMVPAPGVVTGSVKLNGAELVGVPATDLPGIRGRKAAMIFQNPMRSLNPFFSVGRQMTDVIRLHFGCSLVDAHAAAIQALSAAQLPDPGLVLAKFPHQLSGGQMQRVMIALALACKPAFLIADEPTTALDVTVQAQIVSLLRKLADEFGLAVLLISHDLGVVSMVCDRVAVMYAGRVMELGSVDAIIGSPQHPYTRKLISVVPEIGKEGQELGSIPGSVPNPWALPPGCAFSNRCEFASELCRRAKPDQATVAPDHWAACHNVDRQDHVPLERMGKAS